MMFRSNLSLLGRGFSAAVLMMCFTSVCAAQLEFHYTFDSIDAPGVDATGKNADLGLFTNGEEHRVGENSLIGGDGFSIGLDAPGDAHPTGSFMILGEAPQPESFSFSIWVQPALTGTNQGIVARDNVWWPSPCNFYCLYIADDQSLVWRTGGEETIVTDDGVIGDGELHHIAVTHLDTDGPDTGSADRSRIYLDGQLLDDATNPAEIPSLDELADDNEIYQNIWLGTRSSRDGYAGEFDDFQFYNGELTGDEVASLFASPGSVIGGGATGDFDGDGDLDIDDINQLVATAAAGSNTAAFDITGDAVVNRDDISAWLDITNTWIGDSNLDGEFNSTDFVTVFQAGEYEDTTDGNSSWATGDWNGDGDFNSTDFVAAFQAGGYEQGPRPAAAVPEPSSLALVLIGLLSLTAARKRS